MGMAKARRGRTSGDTVIFICPYAQFGNPGTAAGAELIGDALREMLEDAEAESRPSRGQAYRERVRIEELTLDTPEQLQAWRPDSQAIARGALDRGDFLIWIGGNHLSVTPLYEELGRRDGLVVQFDAHLDIYHFDQCKTAWSHGNFIRHLPEPRPAIVNVGHRDQFLTADEIARHYADVRGIDALVRDQREVVNSVTKRVRAAKSTLIDIDCDVMDPAYFPAVVDQLPFGLVPQQLLNLLMAMDFSRAAAIAFSEFDPGRDDRDRSLQLAVWLIEQVLLWRYGNSTS